MKTVLIAGLLALALLPPALAHNGGPATSGSCGVMACEDQVILNGCGLEVEVAANVGDPLDLSELPCPHAGTPPVDHDRWSSYPAPGAAERRSGISGRYVGSTGPLLEATGSQSSIFPQAGIGPIELFGIITILCDVEVGGNGQAPDPDLDETTVDGTAGGGGAGTTTGGVPNALWDDGGIGGACHTSTYGYDNAAHTLYNSPGCPTGDYAMAEDILLGDSVEIGVGCDNTIAAPGNNDGPDVQGALGCVINEVILQQDLGALNGCLAPLVSSIQNGAGICEARAILAWGPGLPGTLPQLEAALNACVGPRVLCITNPATCVDPADLVCGSDGVTDSINFGEGGGHANPASSGPYNEDGVPYPAPVNGCLNTGGNGQVYVIAGVRAEVPAVADLTGNDGIGISLSLVPTLGWISQVQSTGPAVFVPQYNCEGTGSNYVCAGNVLHLGNPCYVVWVDDDNNANPDDSGASILSVTC
ncbi:MAG: hypothetical protein QOG31_1139 [Thermoplasmata archaeon]|jgi:hypothetical protein|nr:hypothetical protein [Thermoplasmata archaeon]